jgi:alpha-L-arabinofuranosidase
VIDKASNELIVKVVNVSAAAQSIQLNIEGVKKLPANGTITVLKSDQLTAVNSLGEVAVVRPSDKEIAINGGKINVGAAPYSFTVFKIKM